MVYAGECYVPNYNYGQGLFMSLWSEHATDIIYVGRSHKWNLHRTANTIIKIDFEDEWVMEDWEYDHWLTKYLPMGTTRSSLIWAQMNLILRNEELRSKLNVKLTGWYSFLNGYLGKKRYHHSLGYYQNLANTDQLNRIMYQVIKGHGPLELLLVMVVVAREQTLHTRELAYQFEPYLTMYVEELYQELQPLIKYIYTH